MKAVAVVPAAGAGKRLKQSRRKSFATLRGRPLLYWTLAALTKSAAIDGIILVVHPRDQKKTRDFVRRHRFGKVIDVVPGGATRTDSVYQGIRALPAETRWVLVHDAARPLVTAQVVAAVVNGAKASGAAIAAVPVVPTIKQARGRWVTGTLVRNHLWAVQTPQVFRRELLEKAHELARRKKWKATDDAALVEATGRRVRIVMGDSRNIKVTTPEDLFVAEAFLRCG